MFERFVLYVWDAQKERSVPILLLSIHRGVVEFFDKNDFVDKSKYDAFMEWIIEHLQKLNIFLPADYVLLIDTYSVAVVCGREIDHLPEVVLK
jgi:hypothetical protein